jgi:hypothetical protein
MALPKPWPRWAGWVSTPTLAGSPRNGEGAGADQLGSDEAAVLAAPGRLEGGVDPLLPAHPAPQCGQGERVARALEPAAAPAVDAAEGLGSGVAEPEGAVDGRHAVAVEAAHEGAIEDCGRGPGGAGDGDAADQGLRDHDDAAVLAADEVDALVVRRLGMGGDDHLRIPPHRRLDVERGRGDWWPFSRPWRELP